MTNAQEPKTDRELLLMINGHVTQLVDDMKEVKEQLSEKTNINYCDRQHIETDKELLDHNKRIGSLENWRWYMVGGITLLGFLILAIVQILR